MYSRYERAGCDAECRFPAGRSAGFDVPLRVVEGCVDGARLSREEKFAATEHDKKNTGSARVMVFPRRVGEMRSVVSAQ